MPFLLKTPGPIVRMMALDFGASISCGTLALRYPNAEVHRLTGVKQASEIVRFK